MYLGKLPERAARSVLVRIMALEAAGLSGTTPDPETSTWVGALDEVMYGKLAAVGLVASREPKAKADPATLGPFLDSFIAGRTDVKGGTRINYGQVKNNLLKYFGAEKPLADITPGDADEFRRSLSSRLAENTVRRHCGRAKQFFRAAVRKRLIAENPFGDMKACAVKANASRFYFVSREDARAVLDTCPDAQWRLLFALSRFGGLRVPSEPLGLRWADVDWERARITVSSPKTEHIEGGESRQIPIFPELRPYLEEAWEQAEPGTEWVITRYRSTETNLRTQLHRIIKRAGLTPWPKCFQNCRSTRETELAESNPLHVVCSWIGNSQAVAQKHYLQVTDEHFTQAAKGNAQYDARATQNPTQPISAGVCHHSTESTQPLATVENRPALAKAGEAWQNRQVTPTGLEPVLPA